MKCSNDGLVCSQCATNWTLSTIQKCDCPGYTIGNLCGTCSSLIPGCLSCSSGVQCTACDTIAHWQLVTNLQGTFCRCKSGYYLPRGVASPTCQVCSIDGCLECESATVCLVCDGTKYRQLSYGKCICEPGLLHSLADCYSPCMTTLDGCLTCSSPSVCLTCLAGGNWFLSGSLCLCDSGYFKSGTPPTTTCSPCSSISGCVSCTSSTSCTTCNSTAKWSPSGGVCACSLGYYQVDVGASATCSKCIVGCETCYDSVTCVYCDVVNSWVLSGFVCVCGSGSCMMGTMCVGCSVVFDGC